MQKFIDTIKLRVGTEEFNKIQSFYEIIEKNCDTDEKQKYFEFGQENTIIILPLELDYDMIFAGLVLPLIRNNLLDTKLLYDYKSALDLWN